MTREAYQLNVVCIHKDCAQIHYQTEALNKTLEKDLDQVFAKHGYSRWASGYGGCVRDLGYEKQLEG